MCINTLFICVSALGCHFTNPINNLYSILSHYNVVLLGQHRKLEAIMKPSEKEINIGPVMFVEHGKLLKFL